MNGRCIVFLGGLLALASYAQSSLANAADLRDVEDVPKLRIAPDKVQLVEHHQRSLPLSATARDKEHRVATENSRLLGYQRFDAKGVCRLRVVTETGGQASEIRCNSQLIAVPKGKDVVWIAGKVRNEGRLEQGKASPHSGLHLYSTSGDQIGEVPSSQTGAITLLAAADDGTVFAVSEQGKAFHLIRASNSGQLIGDYPLAYAPSELKLLNGGQYVALKSRQWQQNKQVATLLTPDGKQVAEFSDSTEVAPEILAVTSDGKYVLVAKNLQRPDDRVIEAYQLSDTKALVKKIKVDFYPDDLLVTNDLTAFIARRSQGTNGEGENSSFQVLDGAGKEISHYECSAERGTAHPEWGGDQHHVDFACGDMHVQLKIK
jgi:hypothetical protein